MVSVLSVILPSLVPVFTDGIRSLIARVTGIGGAEPKTIDERIKLTDSETKRLVALSSLDNPGGEISRWVANFRALHRYVLADLILLFTFAYVLIPGINIEIANFLLNLSASVFGFFFGDRVYLHLRGKS
jgi:hypothetical protein